MSLAQIEAEVSRLSREELKRLEETVHAALRRVPIVETPEMLDERRRVVDEFLAGDECVELETFEQDQAKDREKDDQLSALWRE